MLRAIGSGRGTARSSSDRHDAPARIVAACNHLGIPGSSTLGADIARRFSLCIGAVALALRLGPRLRPASAVLDQGLAVLERVGKRAVGHARQVDGAARIAAGARVEEEARLGAAAGAASVGVMHQGVLRRRAADREVVAVAHPHAQGSIGAAEGKGTDLLELTRAERGAGWRVAVGQGRIAICPGWRAGTEVRLQEALRLRRFHMRCTAQHEKSQQQRNAHARRHRQPIPA